MYTISQKKNAYHNKIYMLMLVIVIGLVRERVSPNLNLLLQKMVKCLDIWVNLY